MNPDPELPVAPHEAAQDERLRVNFSALTAPTIKLSGNFKKSLEPQNLDYGPCLETCKHLHRVASELMAQNSVKGISHRDGELSAISDQLAFLHLNNPALEEFREQLKDLVLEVSKVRAIGMHDQSFYSSGYSSTDVSRNVQLLGSLHGKTTIMLAELGQPGS